MTIMPTTDGTPPNNNRGVPATIIKKIDNCKGKLFKATINNYSDDDFNLLKSYFSDNKKIEKWIIGKEIGEQGTPHLQCYFRFNCEFRRTTLKAIIIKDFYCDLVKRNKNDSVEKIDKEQWDYCSKENNFISNYSYKQPDIISELRPFQKQLLNMLLGPVEPGKINWVYDPEGQLGKTEFLRYMFLKHKIPFTYGGKCSDIINLVYNNKDYMLNTEKPALIYNFGRDTEPNKISYKSMEQVSDGCISNTKFEAGCFVCPWKPHVLILANCLPIMNKLTKSRWKVFTINKNLELINYKPLYDPKD